MPAFLARCVTPRPRSHAGTIYMLGLCCQQPPAPERRNLRSSIWLMRGSLEERRACWNLGAAGAHGKPDSSIAVRPPAPPGSSFHPETKHLNTKCVHQPGRCASGNGAGQKFPRVYPYLHTILESHCLASHPKIFTICPFIKNVCLALTSSSSIPDVEETWKKCKSN